MANLLTLVLRLRPHSIKLICEDSLSNRCSQIPLIPQITHGQAAKATVFDRTVTTMACQTLTFRVTTTWQRLGLVRLIYAGLVLQSPKSALLAAKSITGKLLSSVEATTSSRSLSRYHVLWSLFHEN
jgi:hypothetical protein